MDGSEEPDLLVREAVMADVPVLVRWQVAMAAETEGRQLPEARVRRGVEAVLSDPARGFYLVAEAEGAPRGGLLVTREWSDWRAADFWWLQSVYVETDWRGRGLFRRLQAEVEARARAGGAAGLRLYVEHDNQRAQRTYLRAGYEPAAYRMMEREFIR